MSIYISTFRADITPPIGHPLCAGWQPPVSGIDDRLFALGVVFTGPEPPAVLCALDFCELSNKDYILWREVLAEAAGTTPERVAVQCVHQHDAPWPDIGAQELVVEHDCLPAMMDVDWCREVIHRVAEELRKSLDQAYPITHAEIGEAAVEKLASNRRIMGPDGKVKAVRYTHCADPEIRAEPEGLIDPMLKTVSLWSDERKLAAIHYYAVHPCSYYGDGMVNIEFVGHAREKWKSEDAGEHIYFTGCAGNIGAGKYNDGSRENRAIFADRIYKGLVKSEQNTDRISVDSMEWRTVDLRIPPDDRRPVEELRSTLADPSVEGKYRYKAAFRLEYMRHFESGAVIPLTCLLLGDSLAFVNLPGEAFIEYQLLSQELLPDHFVCVASYGDCGTGYIPMERSYEEGGYEPRDAFVSPACEEVMRTGLNALLTKSS